MSSDTAIKVENLSKCYQIYDQPRDRLKQFVLPRIQQLIGRPPRQFYREFWALKDVSFDVKKGETVGIIGRNGSGKSTLLQIITGTLAPTSGSLTVLGRVAALLELGSGFNPEFSGYENVYMNASLLGLSKVEIDARFDDIASFADIGSFIEQPVKTYSSGMFARLAFAVSVNVDPEILIVDEALAVGDIRFQVKCHRKFEEFRSMGKTILLVSHSGSDITRLCDRAIWLNSGQMKRVGPAKQLVEEYIAWMVLDTGVQVPAQKNEITANFISGDLNEFKLLPIPENATITGDGGANVFGIGLYNAQDELLTILDGAQRVTIRYAVSIKQYIDRPFLSVQVLDRKGMIVFGISNISMEHEFDPFGAGSLIDVGFEFYFPEIANGEYLIAIGINDGGLGAGCHLRHQYIIDAYCFQFESASPHQKQGGLLKLKDCVISLRIKH